MSSNPTGTPQRMDFIEAILKLYMVLPAATRHDVRLISQTSNESSI